MMGYFLLFIVGVILVISYVIRGENESDNIE